MPSEIKNVISDMWLHRGNKVNTFGKDQTQTVTYTFNQQGFRSNLDYNWTPQVALFGGSLVMGVGVDQSKITSAYFDNCQKYGLACNYTNRDILTTVKNFSTSDLYTPATRLAVVWTDRNAEYLEDCYAQLINLNIVHFFCGNVLDYPRCYKFISQIDLDASNTHPGVLTHKTFYKILCTLFKQ
jgi:hypothetical protein